MLGRQGAKNITKLNLSKNVNMTEKTGILIGEALIQNFNMPISKISFKKVYRGESGLLRILEACNINCNITKLNLGTVSDRGLKIMAKVLK